MDPGNAAQSAVLVLRGDYCPWRGVQGWRARKFPIRMIVPAKLSRRAMGLRRIIQGRKAGSGGRARGIRASRFTSGESIFETTACWTIDRVSLKGGDPPEPTVFN